MKGEALIGCFIGCFLARCLGVFFNFWIMISYTNRFPFPSISSAPPLAQAVLHSLRQSGLFCISRFIAEKDSLTRVNGGPLRDRRNFGVYPSDRLSELHGISNLLPMHRYMYGRVSCPLRIMNNKNCGHL